MLTIGFRPNIGGIETHFEDLLKAAIRRGYSFTILTYQPLTTPIIAPFVEKGENCKIFRLPIIRGFFFKLVGKPLIEFLYLTPGLFIATPILLFFNPGLKVIHAHGLVAGFIAVIWGRIFKKKIIISIHSVYNFPASGNYRNFASWLFKNADIDLGLSKKAVEEIRSLGVDEKKVKKFTYWIDLERFKVLDKKVSRKKLDLQDRFIILFVGRLIEEKGVEPLIEAAKKFKAGILLVMVGRGPLEEYVKRMVLGSNGKIIYRGGIDNEKLPLYYNAADLTIVPSIHEEGFGRVILESLACGTPVIGSRRGAIPEAMNDQVGKLIDIKDNNIENTVNEFYKNPLMIRRLSKQARLFALSKYSVRNINQVIKYYE